MNQEWVSEYDIRGTRDEDLTIERAWNAGKALADQLAISGQVIVVYIATQKELAHALIEGLRLQGRDVIDGGEGDATSVRGYIKSMSLAGGAVIAFDDLALTSTITLFNEKAQLIDTSKGLDDIRALIESGNFVPAVIKGQLTALA